MSPTICESQTAVLDAISTPRVPAKAKRPRSILVTVDGRELVVVCCLDLRRSVVLAVLGDGTGDVWADEMPTSSVRGLTPEDVYCDAMPLLERKAKCVINEEGRLNG